MYDIYSWVVRKIKNHEDIFSMFLTNKPLKTTENNSVVFLVDICPPSIAYENLYIDLLLSIQLASNSAPNAIDYVQGMTLK